ncbi:helix-turn-helix transcriptional regulator [Ruoffia tabacinasalis]|uniref:Helix-turn-helix transcriptional regulator n=1 Tax=Ruoffia tabacinasalis TaxID=87458 RepID=A0A5R9ENU2_9LACT|nr:helix-turn-helix transcriptional regulator [Ruoffia tabacinasalis]TLQ49309.1 helix-turn-helix transcriptional regulator [Ruoffia tabacinasalis]
MTDFIGENLKALRQQAGLTTRDVANYLDVGHAIVAKWEKSKANITDERLEELAKYYGVTIEDLEFGVIR